MSQKLQRVERNTFYDLPVHCCFCGQQVVGSSDVADELELIPCPHTLFIAHDEAFEFLSDRVAAQLREKGFEVEFEEERVEVWNENVEEERNSPEFITDELEFSDGVKIASYVGAPSGFGSYVGFAPDDSDYER